MNILVTGGAGHIGSFIVDALIERDHKVTILDDFSIGKHKHCNRKADILQDSILDEHAMLRYVKDLYPDVIVNCAVKPLLMSFDKPKELVAVNYFGVQTLLNAIADVYDVHEFPLFVQLSTSEVYGGGKITNNSPKEPKTIYARSKQAADELVKLYHSLHKMPFAIARPFNSVGERMRMDEYANVIYKTFMRILTNQPVIIEGSGQQARDFPYVRDIADGIVMMIESEGVYEFELNFSTGLPITIKNVIADCISIANNDGREYNLLQPLIAPERKADYRLLTCYSKEAWELLGWYNHFTFTEALKITYDWIKQELGIK